MFDKQDVLWETNSISGHVLWYFQISTVTMREAWGCQYQHWESLIKIPKETCLHSPSQSVANEPGFPQSSHSSESGMTIARQGSLPLSITRLHSLSPRRAAGV